LSAWITNGPITGQGADPGSRCAGVTAEAIAGGGPYREEFGRSVAAEMWRVAGPVTEWSNAFLQPPAEHVFRLFTGAAGAPGGSRADQGKVIIGQLVHKVAFWVAALPTWEPRRKCRRHGA
jgi:hypothetical protein